VARRRHNYTAKIRVVGPLAIATRFYRPRRGAALITRLARPPHSNVYPTARVALAAAKSLDKVGDDFVRFDPCLGQRLARKQIAMPAGQASNHHKIAGAEVFKAGIVHGTHRPMLLVCSPVVSLCSAVSYTVKCRFTLTP
jgi:hypothetical protein